MPAEKLPRQPCGVTDCPRLSVYADEKLGHLCRPHLNRLTRHGDVLAHKPVQAYGGGRRVGEKMPPPVSIPPRPEWALGWCKPCHRWVNSVIHPSAVVLDGVL